MAHASICQGSVPPAAAQQSGYDVDSRFTLNPSGQKGRFIVEKSSIKNEALYVYDDDDQIENNTSTRGVPVGTPSFMSYRRCNVKTFQFRDTSHAVVFPKRFFRKIWIVASERNSIVPLEIP